MFWKFVKVVWDHLGCVWGVFRGPQEQLLSMCFRFLCFFEKCLGGSRTVLGVPRTPLKHIVFPEMQYCFKMCLYIAYYIAYCIAYCISIAYSIAYCIAYWPG